MVNRIAVAMVVCLASVAPAFAAGSGPDRRPPGINAREHRQAERIKAGVKDNDITRAELNRLRADEAAIRAEERLYRRSGDGLSKAEIKDLEKGLNKTSREIYRAKHNNRKPPQPQPSTQQQ